MVLLQSCSLLLCQFFIFLPNGSKLSLSRLLLLPKLSFQRIDSPSVSRSLSLIGALDLGVILDQSLNLGILGDQQLGQSVIFSIQGIVLERELSDRGLETANGTPLHRHLVVKLIIYKSGRKGI